MSAMQDRVVLITGAARGVGKVIARRFAESGAHVLINYFHSSDEAKRTKSEFEAAGAKVEIIRGSVANRAQVEKMFESIRERHGRLDVLVNNAASGALVPYASITDEYLDRAFNTNLKGSFWCSWHAAGLMEAAGGGSIINLSTLGGERLVMANYLACGVAKAAVEALTRYLANEFAPRNIRVNTAAAGMLESEVAQKFPDAAAMHSEIRKATPMGRLGKAEEFADVILFLASEQSRWVTGQTVLADGGLSLGSALLSPPRLANPAGSAAAAPSETPSVATAVAQEADEEIAIVGMGLTVPGAKDPSEYWKILMEGFGDAFREVPADRWNNSNFFTREKSAEDKTYSERSAFITDASVMPRGEAESMEYTTYWLRRSLLQALGGVARAESDRFSFSVGYTADGSQHLEEAMVLAGALHRLGAALDGAGLSEEVQGEMRRGMEAALRGRYPRGAGASLDFLPHRVGMRAMEGVLPAGTKLQMVDTACSSSLYAMDIGIKGLRSGAHDIAVCGGAFALGPRGSILFAKLNGLSARGEVRALDRAGDGVLFADGAGVVIMKTLRRALADRDRILAVAKAFGSSSDGKGKAIYAPSSSGQAIAIRRAFSSPALALADVDYVVAHATGTPAGDLAEFTTLREIFSTGRPVYVTSNKSVIGHTGWAAGVVSVIEVILAMQHGVIPPQHRYTAPPEDFLLEKGNLVIPERPVAWARHAGKARTASVSGFGFGGTNAHLVLQEYREGLRPVLPGPRRVRERIALVSWSCHLPGVAAQNAEGLILDPGREMPPGFGDIYPIPSFQRVRMPPSTARTIDRSQLMILECAHELKRKLGLFWEENKEKTGIFLGHMGATRNATLYGARCYLDEIRLVLESHPVLAASGSLNAILAAYRASVKALVPPSNEDSFPGSMPNVIPARIANYFGLNGLNMTLDTGFSSALTAFEIACRYLQDDELDMVLAGGINGNITPEMCHILSQLPGGRNAVWSEGALLFALARESKAREAGLEPLAWVGQGAAEGLRPAREVECGWVGDPASKPRANYLGAEGMMDVLKAVLSPGEDLRLVCRREDGSRAELRLSPPEPEGVGRNLPETDALPARFISDAEWDAGKPLEISRHVLELRPAPLKVECEGREFFPDGSLILTDQPVLLEGFEIGHRSMVLSTAALETRIAGSFQVAELSVGAVEGLVKEANLSHRHIRVVTSLGRSAPSGECLVREPESLVRLHTLAFLALKACHKELQEGKGSFLGLFLDAFPEGRVHPHTGLFGGLVKCAAMEFPAAPAFFLFTGESGLKNGILQAREESKGRRYLPVVYMQDGVRKTPAMVPQPSPLPERPAARLTGRSVVIAVGGARGITAEIMKAVSRHFRPRIHLIGSNDLQLHPGWVYSGSDSEFRERKADYIRSRREAEPGKPVAAFISEFNRMAEARLSRRNLEEMENWCGPGRVKYHCCSILDRDRLEGLIRSLRENEGRIDLLVNSAGLNKSSPIAAKSLQDFLSIRDIKLRGYHNLKWAFRHQPPALWCNFGSLLGLTGQLGEADYASANDFLSSAALFAPNRVGEEEFTLGWTLWGEVGMGANGLTKEYFEKSGTYSNMTTGEGIHHFVREIHAAERSASIVHLGRAEVKAIQKLVPGFLDAQPGSGPGPVPASADTDGATQRGRVYLDRVIHQAEGEAVFEKDFSLERDAYLKGHLVNGFPTLPGTFLTEIAAEASLFLVPDLAVIGFEDLFFHRFLRVFEGGNSNRKRIHARLLERRSGQALIQIRVLTDVYAPNGTLLIKGKLHFEIKVLAAESFPAAPIWQAWPVDGEEPVADPYHMTKSPVLLTGSFVTTAGTRCGPKGKRAESALKVRPDQAPFPSFLVPSLLLDGLARVGVLGARYGGYLPLAAPTSIRRVDLYEPGNDLELWKAHGSLGLHATPRDFNMEDGKGSNRLVAVRPDGRIVLQMQDVSATVIGYMHRETGEFHSPAEIAGAAERQIGETRHV